MRPFSSSCDNGVLACCMPPGQSCRDGAVVTKTTLRGRRCGHEDSAAGTALWSQRQRCEDGAVAMRTALQGRCCGDGAVGTALQLEDGAALTALRGRRCGDGAVGTALQLEDGAALTALRGRRCGDGAAGTVLWGWRCRDGAAGTALRGWCCGDGAVGTALWGRRYWVGAAGTALWGRRCGDGAVGTAPQPQPRTQRPQSRRFDISLHMLFPQSPRPPLIRSLRRAVNTGTPHPLPSPCPPSHLRGQEATRTLGH